MTQEEAISKLHGLIYGVINRQRVDNTCREVIDYLKAQEPRVMTLEELDALGDDDVVWLECLYTVDGTNKTTMKPAIYQPDNSSPDEDGYYCVVSSWGKSGFYHEDNYMGDWRCWKSRPSDEVRRATPWMRTNGLS